MLIGEGELAELFWLTAQTIIAVSLTAGIPVVAEDVNRRSRAIVSSYCAMMGVEYVYEEP